MNVLVVGAGYFAQTVHLKCLRHSKEVKKVFIFDERKKLSYLVAKNFKFYCLENFTSKELKKKKISLAIVCFQREKSYHYCYQLLKNDVNVFAEKPIVFSKKKN